MIVCHCNVVRDDEIRTEVRLGATTVEEAGARCSAGTRCGGCLLAVEATIADEMTRAAEGVPARG